MAPGLRVRGTDRIAVVVAALQALACASTASFLFDLPESETRPAGASAAAGTALQDTTPPRIETLDDRDSILALLPKLATGTVDWDRAMRSGVTRPRPAPPRAWRRYLDGFGYDLVLKSGDGSFPARFPHSRHVTQFTCETCHPALWGSDRTDNSMAAINGGASCGACHGTVAFPPSACGRCHEGLPTPTTSTVLEDDLVLARDSVGAGAATQAMPPSRFAHWVHRIRYRCSACHTALFALEAGSDTLTMASLSQGQACGACHDDVEAFGLTSCQRCHTAPERAEPAP